MPCRSLAPALVLESSDQVPRTARNGSRLVVVVHSADRLAAACRQLVRFNLNVGVMPIGNHWVKSDLLNDAVVGGGGNRQRPHSSRTVYRDHANPLNTGDDSVCSLMTSSPSQLVLRWLPLGAGTG